MVESGIKHHNPPSINISICNKNRDKNIITISMNLATIDTNSVLGSTGHHLNTFV
jgi:hypothetical protein